MTRQRWSAVGDPDELCDRYSDQVELIPASASAAPPETPQVQVAGHCSRRLSCDQLCTVTPCRHSCSPFARLFPLLYHLCAATRRVALTYTASCIMCSGISLYPRRRATCSVRATSRGYYPRAAILPLQAMDGCRRTVMSHDLQSIEAVIS
jgi:hypothetical protein